MLEKTLEARCCRYAYKSGAYVLKLWPTRAGLPDRLFLLPGGRAWFVEFKTAKGRISPVQVLVMGNIERLGFRGGVIRDFPTFKAILDTMLRGRLK